MGEETYVALLRGINVGGRNKLPMKALVEMFEAAGCREVRTYIQSGNVVYNASKKTAAKAPSVVSEAIAKAFSLRIPVVTRTATELSDIAASNPFIKSGVNQKALHVAFLLDTPEPSRMDALNADRFIPDVFRLRGRDIYLFCPNGLARTKLTNAYLANR